MSTYLEDLAPELRAAYRLAGNSDRRHLAMMVLALSLHSWNNTAEENLRLQAAKFILAGKPNKKGKVKK